jgi:hypothetical protein
LPGGRGSLCNWREMTRPSSPSSSASTLPSAPGAILATIRKGEATLEIGPGR